MSRYLALIEYDNTAGAYGLVIPDLPGCNAMGLTLDEVESNGIEALSEWAHDIWADDGDLPPPRSETELRADPTLFDDFTPNVFVKSLPVQHYRAHLVPANASQQGGPDA